jgi:hypothetical protein
MRAKLDGKVFQGQVGLKGSKKGDKDVLVFEDGRFLSTACVAYGFSWARYAATGTKGGVTFRAKPKNNDADTLSWTGTLKGGRIEGVAIHRSKDAKTGKVEVTEFWFGGKLLAA